jgi:uncharacterized membrane protein
MCSHVSVAKVGGPTADHGRMPAFNNRIALRPLREVAMTCTYDSANTRLRASKGALGLGLSVLLVLGSFAGAADAAPHGGGGHGGGARGAGGGHSGGGHRGGGGYRGGGGWGGGYYAEPPVVYGSPYYCAPPLAFGIFGSPYGYCQ